MANTGTAVRPFGMRDKLGYMFGDFGNEFHLHAFFQLHDGVLHRHHGRALRNRRPADDGGPLRGRLHRRGHGPDRGPRQAHQGRPVPSLDQADVRPCGHRLLPDLSVRVRRHAHGLQGRVDVRHLPAVGAPCSTPPSTSPTARWLPPFPPEANDRTQLSTFRSIGATLANMVIGTATPLLAYETVNGVPQLSGSRMIMMAGLFSVCAIVCYILCFSLTTERVEIPAKDRRSSSPWSCSSAFSPAAPCWASSWRPCACC